MHAMPTSFASHLLIAMPAMDDPNFRHAVALLCQHDEGGAMGIVINRVSEYTLGELLAQNSWLTVPADDAILFRTPLAERWQAATRGLGFDPGHLSSTAGHA